MIVDLCFVSRYRVKTESTGSACTVAGDDSSASRRAAVKRRRKSERTLSP